MLSTIRKLSSSVYFPLFWTILTIVLLCIPGSDLPHDGFLSSIRNFDKLVHLGLFGGIVLFWGSWKHLQTADDLTWFRFICTTTFAVIVLGVALEFVQLHFIPNRDFDRADISADTAGALAAFGYLIIKRRD